MRNFPPLLWILLLLLTGCARDPLEEAAWQASRVGTAVGDSRRGGGTAGLEAGARVVERFYYVAKYQASLEQRHVAETAARRGVKKVAKRAAATGRKPPRYIAVLTRPDNRATTQTNVMIWDVAIDQIVGNNVYDLNEAPPSGQVVKFETYSAEYVGTGG